MLDVIRQEIAGIKSALECVRGDLFLMTEGKYGDISTSLYRNSLRANVCVNRLEGFLKNPTDEEADKLTRDQEDKFRYADSYCPKEED